MLDDALVRLLYDGRRRTDLVSILVVLDDALVQKKKKLNKLKKINNTIITIKS